MIRVKWLAIQIVTTLQVICFGRYSQSGVKHHQTNTMFT